MYTEIAQGVVRLIQKWLKSGGHKNQEVTRADKQILSNWNKSTWLLQSSPHICMHADENVVLTERLKWMKSSYFSDKTLSRSSTKWHNVVAKDLPTLPFLGSTIWLQLLRMKPGSFVWVSDDSWRRLICAFCWFVNKRTRGSCSSGFLVVFQELIMIITLRYSRIDVLLFKHAMEPDSMVGEVMQRRLPLLSWWRICCRCTFSCIRAVKSVTPEKVNWQKIHKKHALSLYIKCLQ